MKPPSEEDRVVNVSARLTDETFGYDHWRAGQFSFGGNRNALLVLLRDGEDPIDIAARIGVALGESA